MNRAEKKMAILHLLCGLPGSGKTTLARQLEANGAGVRFAPDEWLIELELGLHDPGKRDRIESLQWCLAQRLLTAGVSVILENGFWLRSERMRYRDTAAAIGATTCLHFLDVPLHELETRVTERNRHVPPDQKVWVEYLADWFTAFEAPKADELGVVTYQTPA